MNKRKSKPEVFHMRVDKGCFVPADGYTRNRLRERGYHTGDVVGCTFKKLNSPGFNRLIHRIGQLCAANIEAFHGMDAHKVLKRLQYEANVHCEEMAVMLPEYGTVATLRFPLSWAFCDMDDGARHEAARAICRHISAKYWPTLTAEAVEEMAENWVEEI